MLKRILVWIALGFGGSVAMAQSPDCVRYFNFKAADTTAYLDNRQTACVNWTMNYVSSGFTALTLTFQSSTGALTPTGFTSYTGTVNMGSVNPSTNTTSSSASFTGYVGWVQVSLSGLSGNGNVVGVLYGFKSGYASLGGGGSGGSQLHTINLSRTNNGSVLPTGDFLMYGSADFACTINRVDISADQSGSVTVDIWKVSAAIPTSGNKISASAPVTLASAQLAQNGNLSGWTTSVAANDVFGASIQSVTSVTSILIQIWCQ